jgi:hypothetical protein
LSLVVWAALGVIDVGQSFLLPLLGICYDVVELADQRRLEGKVDVVSLKSTEDLELSVRGVSYFFFEAVLDSVADFLLPVGVVIKGLFVCFELLLREIGPRLPFLCTCRFLLWP